MRGRERERKKEHNCYWNHYLPVKYNSQKINLTFLYKKLLFLSMIHQTHGQFLSHSTGFKE